MRFSGCFPLLQHSLQLKTTCSTNPACSLSLMSCWSATQAQASLLILKQYCHHVYCYLFIFSSPSSSSNSPVSQLSFLCQSKFLPASFCKSCQAFTFTQSCRLPSAPSVHSAESGRQKEKHSWGQVGSFMPIQSSWRAEGTELSTNGVLRYLSTSNPRS